MTTCGGVAGMCEVVRRPIAGKPGTRDASSAVLLDSGHVGPSLGGSANTRSLPRPLGMTSNSPADQRGSAARGQFTVLVGPQREAHGMSSRRIAVSSRPPRERLRLRARLTRLVPRRPGRGCRIGGAGQLRRAGEGDPARGPAPGRRGHRGVHGSGRVTCADALPWTGCLLMACKSLGV